jgi:predicted RNA-binding protein with EMAP domain
MSGSSPLAVQSTDDWIITIRCTEYRGEDHRQHLQSAKEGVQSTHERFKYCMLAKHKSEDRIRTISFTLYTYRVQITNNINPEYREDQNHRL